jgi:hypothetical protein
MLAHEIADELPRVLGGLVGSTRPSFP